MRAIVVDGFGGPDVLRVADVADPVAAAGRVVVRVSAAGVNPVEAYVRAGQYGPKSFPYTPGTDVAGTVERVGDGVVAVRPGDRVYGYCRGGGGYAERVACDVAEVYPLPPRVSFAQGAAVGIPYATAYRALFVRGGARPHEVVLVHGASGGVGLAACQLAVNHGCVVVGTAGTEAGLDVVCRQGVALTLNHHKPNYLDQLSAFTGGRGADLIVEMLANVNLDRDLGVLAGGGRVVVVGSRGRVEIDPRQTMVRDADVRGLSLMNAGDGELAMMHAAIGAGLTNGTLVPVVAKSFPLAEAGAAQAAVMGGGATGKIVLVME